MYKNSLQFTAKICNFTAILSGEITYFSSELWGIFVRSPFTQAVNLHNFTAFTTFHRKIMYEICGERTNFSPLILHIFPIFSQPGGTRFQTTTTKRGINLTKHVFRETNRKYQVIIGRFRSWSGSCVPGQRSYNFFDFVLGHI